MQPVPRFFVDTGAVRGGTVRIEGEDAAHLARSLRARSGDRIVVVENGTREHGVVLIEAGATRVTGAIEWTRAATGESRLRVHVLQAPPARGMDDAVEALTVAGAYAIQPVITERAVVRPDSAAAGRRAHRWTAIAREAAMLAGRARPPDVAPVRPLTDALAALPSGCPILACVAGSDGAAISAVNLDGDSPVACVIGPEGGLGALDLTALRAAGAVPVHLGERIVPARLAGFLAVSLMLAATGALDHPPATIPAAAAYSRS